MKLAIIVIQKFHPTENFKTDRECILIKFIRKFILRMNIGLRAFEFIEVLGIGAYGAVWKVRKSKTNDIYAMKVIDTD